MQRLFPSQQENETIYMVVREHWARLAIKIITWLLLVLAPLVAKHFLNQAVPELFDDSTGGKIITLFTDVYNLILLFALFVIWLLYYLNIQVITNLRIVDISQEGLFSHVISELHIDKIEDVTSETNGILGTMFDYGDVSVQTAGAKEHFIFNNIPHPGQIEKIVLDLYEKNSNFAKEGQENQ